MAGLHMIIQGPEVLLSGCSAISYIAVLVCVANLDVGMPTLRLSEGVKKHGVYYLQSFKAKRHI